ncbi:alpha/beta fold hydrolase [Nocardia sp. NPDC004722]
MTTRHATPRAQIGELRTVGSRRVHVRQDGPDGGRPILLLHGFEGSMHWWDAVTPRLADTLRVIRVDLIGFGCTGGDSGFDAHTQGRMLTDLLEDLDLEDVLAVGHSYGADAALAVAEQSGRVTGAVIVDQGPDYEQTDWAWQGALLARGPLPRLTHAYAPDALLRYVLGRGFAPGFDIDSATPDFAQQRRDSRDMSPHVVPAVAIARRRALRQRPLDHRVRDLGKPTLAIHGSRDQLYDLARTRTRYLAAGAEFAIIPTSGHSPNVETPDELASILLEYAARTELSTIRSEQRARP